MSLRIVAEHCVCYVEANEEYATTDGLLYSGKWNMEEKRGIFCKFREMSQLGSGAKFRECDVTVCDKLTCAFHGGLDASFGGFDHPMTLCYVHAAHDNFNEIISIQSKNVARISFPLPRQRIPTGCHLLR